MTLFASRVRSNKGFQQSRALYPRSFSEETAQFASVVFNSRRQTCNSRSDLSTIASFSRANSRTR
jgi:hypothetical protein